MKRDDTLWKGLIEDLFPEFLEFFYPYDNLLEADSTFEFLDKELQELNPSLEDNAPLKIVDKLIRIRPKEGGEKWILVHVEVQGYHDKNFSERMFEYYYRIRDRYGQEITALAIFTGIWGGNDKYEAEFAGTEVTYRYNVYHIRKTNEERLKSTENIFGLVVLAAKTALRNNNIADEGLMHQYAWIFKALQKKGVSERKMLGVKAFLASCVQFDKPETYRIFEKRLKRITGKRNPMGVIEILEERGHAKGLEEGLKEGLAKAQEQFVTNLLAKLHLSDEQIADIAGVGLEFVQQVKQKLRK